MCSLIEEPSDGDVGSFACENEKNSRREVQSEIAVPQRRVRIVTRLAYVSHGSNGGSRSFLL